MGREYRPKEQDCGQTDAATGEEMPQACDDQTLYGNAFMAESLGCDTADPDADPMLGTSDTSTSSEADGHIVSAGETLQGISEIWYGAPERWDRIWQANYAAIGEHPDRLEPGMWLRIPPSDLAGAVKAELVDEMDFVNRNRPALDYPGSPLPGTTEPTPNGHHDPAYWDDIGGDQWIIRLKKGKSAAAGVRSLVGGPTRTECATILHAVQASAILEVVGDDVFDRHFGAEGDTNQDLVMGAVETASKLQKMFTEVEASGQDDLEPGDEVYIANTEKYERKHPMGFWRGLNAVYVGDGKFSGFRVPNATLKEITAGLVDGYNEHPSDTGSIGEDGYDPSLEHDQITADDVPGLRLTGIQRIDPEALEGLYT